MEYCGPPKASDLRLGPPSGARTANLSATMLFDAGARRVIRGHFERRTADEAPPAPGQVESALATEFRAIVWVDVTLGAARRRPGGRYACWLAKTSPSPMNLRRQGLGRRRRFLSVPVGARTCSEDPWPNREEGGRKRGEVGGFF